MADRVTCPECKGRGIVWPFALREGDPLCSLREKCRTCGGAGWVARDDDCQTLDCVLAADHDGPCREGEDWELGYDMPNQ